MRHIAFLFSAALLAVAVMAGLGHAQTQTGIVQGKVLDQQGAVLPGVTVELVGPMGVKTAVTDSQGEFRFIGVAPSTYALVAELAGFVPQRQEGITVGMGKTVDMDFALKVGGVTESIEVSAASTLVDVRSSSTDTTLSNDLLTTMPIYSATSTGLFEYAPGINSSSAYGGQASYGNALLLDGVDTRDPEGGSAWTFFNQNLIEEIQIGGLGPPRPGTAGSPAGSSTPSPGRGATTTRASSLRYTNEDLASSNKTTEQIDEANPALGNADITKKLVDYTVQAGGPIKKDKAFFFGSVQRDSAVYEPEGPRTRSTDVSPRFNVKLTFQPTPSDTLIFGTQYHHTT